MKSVFIYVNSTALFSFLFHIQGRNRAESVSCICHILSPSVSPTFLLFVQSHCSNTHTSRVVLFNLPIHLFDSKTVMRDWDIVPSGTQTCMLFHEYSKECNRDISRTCMKKFPQKSIRLEQQRKHMKANNRVKLCAVNFKV